MTSYLTAKLVGEGYAKPNADAELPIDINYAKLNEWLVDRKQVPADWNRKLQAIQARASEAARGLPPGFLSQLEGGSDAPLDYLLAQQVLAKLGETAEKGLLGGFKGAAGDWEKIVRAYQYNLIHVAEAAQAVARNTDYEIPYHKKQVAKAQQQLADLERRKAEAHRSAAVAASEYAQECTARGINPHDVRGSLLGMTAGLPALLGAAVEQLQADGITRGMEYYASAAAGSQRQAQQERGQAEPAQHEGAAAEFLPTLCEVREGRTAPPAATPEEASSRPQTTEAEDSSHSAATALAVDWDLGSAAAAEAESGGSGAAPAGISWDLDASDLAGGDDAAGEPASVSGDADFSRIVEGVPQDGAGGAGGGADVTAPAGGTPIEISWEIDISGAGQDMEADTSLSQRQASPAADQWQQQHQDGDVLSTAGAEDEPAAVRRLVHDGAYRARLMDDLYELLAFLKQRCRELSGRSGELLMAGGPEAERHVSADMAASMAESVEAALAALSDSKLKQLTALRTSSRHLDREAATLQQKAAQESKFLGAAAEAEARRGEVQRQLMADSAKLAALTKRTRAAKGLVEAALGANLGRRVNIMGEVNQLI